LLFLSILFSSLYLMLVVAAIVVLGGGGGGRCVNDLEGGASSGMGM